MDWSVDTKESVEASGINVAVCTQASCSKLDNDLKNWKLESTYQDYSV